MQSAKETAANIAASAKAGMEKTKATMQEKAEKMTTRDPLQKEMATEKKEERIHGAERQKQEARAHNVATKQAAAAAGGGTFGHAGRTGGGSYSYTATGVTGQPTGGHQMSALPGHGTGAPTGGQVTEGTIKSHPIGTATGTGRPTTAHNTHVGGGAGTGYGTGDGYSG
ncbi:hypothetical protein DH2020_041638 [Rehmannia glutinosa]|uniref:18 kDa seed maturation protein n=1 Tax=Rehmannia glutinosa TaxID=99300 RepID=A0ABR0UPL5_REHGL